MDMLINQMGGILKIFFNKKKKKTLRKYSFQSSPPIHTCKALKTGECSTTQRILYPFFHLNCSSILPLFIMASVLGGSSYLFLFGFTGSLPLCTGFPLQWLLLLWSTSSTAQAQQLWPTGLDAPRHVGSSWISNQSRVPCIDRWVPYH